MASPSASDVADYIIRWSQDRGEPITNLKLQKLVYYAQAWHLALKKRELFEGDFEAWVHGPVNYPLYQRFKGLRWKPIVGRPPEPPLSDSAIKHIDNVLEVYGADSAYDLERMTHKERPWREARGNLPPDKESRNVIPAKAMRDYYRARLG